MSFSHWLNNLRNRIQTPSAKRHRRKNLRPGSAATQTALNSATESLENRTLLSAVTFNAAPTTAELTLSLDDSGNVQITEDGAVAFSQPAASVSELEIVANDLDNTLFVDFVNGNPIPASGLTFDGVNRGTDFDVLDFGNVVVETLIGDAIDEHDGRLQLVFGDGSTSAINYVNIEPITSTITATNITLNYSATSETITVTDAGSSQTTVNSTAGEVTTFNNPTGTLTINAGDTGVNIVNIDSLLASYPATININGGNGGDTVNVNAAVSLTPGPLQRPALKTLTVR